MHLEEYGIRFTHHWSQTERFNDKLPRCFEEYDEAEEQTSMVGVDRDLVVVTPIKAFGNQTR